MAVNLTKSVQAKSTPARTSKPVNMIKHSHYPIMVRTSTPAADGSGQTLRRTRFHSLTAAADAVQARLKSGSTLEFFGAIAEPK